MCGASLEMFSRILNLFSRKKNKPKSASTRANRNELKLIEPRNSSVRRNVFSVLKGPHSAHAGILPFLDKKTLKAVKETSYELRRAVLNAEEFGDMNTIIKGPLKTWIEQHPKAKYVNISRRKDLNDEDFKDLEDLKNLEYLDMGYCDQAEITDSALTHLKNVHTLIMRGCTQIQNNAFEPLNKLTTLNISYCPQLTTAAFVHFKNIKKLTMIQWHKNTIESKDFSNLKNIEDLNLAFSQPDRPKEDNKGIKEDVFDYLPNPGKLKKLNIIYCSHLTDNIFAKITELRELDMIGCDKLTNNIFTHFGKIKILNMKDCRQITITDKAFENLKSVKDLNIAYCNQVTITDKAFENLKSVKDLNIAHCNQVTITGNTLTRENFPNLLLLHVNGCNKTTLENALENFGVTSTDPNVKPQAGGYTRRSKVRRHSTRRKSN